MTPGGKKLLWKNIVENYHFGFVDFFKLKSDPWSEKNVCRFFFVEKLHFPFGFVDFFKLKSDPWREKMSWGKICRRMALSI
jgi:hypothetical protein